MNNLELLKNLLTQHEGDGYVEFKENFDKERDGKNISAISNIALLKGRDFGYMIFGVENGTKKIVGTNFKPNDYKVGSQNLHIWLSQKLSPKVFLEFIELESEGKNIVIIKIECAKNIPVRFENIAYIRDGESTTNLANYPRIEEKIWNNLKNKNFEKQICAENLSYEEVLKLLDYDKYFTLTKQNLPSETKKFVEKLSEDNLVKIQDNGKYSITVLGAILFARDIQKFDLIKRKTIRVIIYDGNNKNIRKDEIEGQKGYAVGFEGLVDYIISKVGENEEIGRALRVKKSMYPEISLREFIANSIIHQD
ncbi:MAG: putative DNA binding domain-containing protein, partial [Candidatus Gracilibacteria bacterium]|nr:putative DNA binding domain-containing protein [Candidatus Gracilibacteria bacterium]